MNSNEENLLVWEKWRDPFLGYDENEIDVENSNHPHFLGSGDEEDYSEEDYEENNFSNKKPVRIIYTPMGIIPYNEYTASSTIFNFWVGHTSFSITYDIGAIIEQANGVETLDIFTRYRFRIGIGKVFKESEVMQNITQEIQTHLGSIDAS